jgi:predicted enzyme related to lactoylglutathione lyase
MAATNITPGSFSWLELGTSDREGAIKFYTALFGWGYSEFPMGENGEMYTIFNLGERSTGAAYELSLEMTGNGVPPHWMLYVTVTDADATAARVAELGGKVIMQPFNVMDQVRIAVIQDPTGAHISLAQPINHTGLGVKEEPGGFAWADLCSTDAERASKFYVDLFGWSTYVGDSPYIHFKIGEEYIAGAMPGSLPEGVPSHWMPYIMVEGCDASLAKAVSLGAKTVFGPVDLEGVGRFASFIDPQGAAISIYQAVHA